MHNSQDIYSYIETEEARYENDECQIGDNWWWNMRRHIQMLFHLKNSLFFTGANDWLRQFRNVMEGIIELSNWTEDIDIGRDVTFFIEGKDDRALSFVIKKAHDEIYVREHDIDKLVDEITDSDNHYGGVYVQKGAKRPEVIQLNRVAFCDQTQFMGGPRAIKLNFSPSQLKAMEKKGWGKESNGATITIQDLCDLASYQKDMAGSISNNKNKTPGKTIEVYIIRGDMPENWLKEDGDEEKFVSQLQVVGLYTDEKENKVGVTLYRKLDEDSDKFFSSTEVEGRAVGRGVGEKILPDQIFTNWKIIHKNSLLEAASKVPLVTDDPTYTNKNKIQDMETLEVTTIEEGKSIQAVPTAMVANIQLFEKAIMEDFEHAQFAGQSYNSIMGKEESSGTTFRGQNQLIQQGRGPHDRKRGQRAKFIEEIYRDWIIPDLVKEIRKGKKFLATLSTEELSWVADQMSTKLSNEKIIDFVLKMKVGDLTYEKLQSLGEMREIFRQGILKKGNKHLMEILSGELEGIEDRIGVNVAGKQKNLSSISDRILSIIEVAIANPQFRANLEANGMTKNFNDLLEYSGLSPVDFATVVNATPQLSPIQQGQIEAPKMMQENGRT